MKRIATWSLAISRSIGGAGRSGILLGVIFALVFPVSLRAEDAVLSPGDLMLAIDEDITSQSRYPVAGNDERPERILDNNVNTKYLNFGEDYSGFIVTLNRGPSILRSMVLTTANDAEERDPASYEIYGTNDAVQSTNNSDGNGGETWTQIATGTLALPATRFTRGDVVVITNETAYTSYKVLFPTVKNGTAANSMQIAEVEMYETEDATGVEFLDEGATVLAVDANSLSSYPVPAENPLNILDNNSNTKYLNFGIGNSGFIVTPSFGAAAVQSMVLRTANDHEERDPASYVIYGTLDPILSLDNSAGEAENWTPIASGDVALPVTRLTKGPVISFANATAYSSYKVLFPTVKNAVAGVATAANSMQIADVFMYQSLDGTGTNVLGSGGTVLAVDPDGMSESAYAAANLPSQALDNDSFTKYVNTGELNSGFIVTPSVGSSIVTSFIITTADTAPESDPSEWKFYGTNDPITSANNSTGKAETWTLIASAAVDLTLNRMTQADPVSFANTTAYTSYKMVFPSVRDRAASLAMQIADIQFQGTVISPLPETLLKPGDAIIAIDTDPYGSASDYPAAENPAGVLDNNTGTKYLNFAEANSGFIVTPVAGASVIHSMRLTTANDAPERDPASFEIYGTNDAIVSTDNSLGTAESWTLIASGPVTLPDLRLDATTVVAFTDNSTAYTSYKVLFPTLRDEVAANSMQIADVALYASDDGSGTSVTAVGDPILGIDADIVPDSGYPAAEMPANAIDGIITTPTGGASKYLNFGMANSGFVVTPTVGSTVVQMFKIVTANDAAERDPVGWELYGTNDSITSTDNSRGELENWTLIGSGDLALPAARFAAGPIVQLTNTLDFTSYRMVFTSIKDDVLADSMQITEVQFYGIVGVSCFTPFADLDGDTDVDQDDFGLVQLCFTGTGGVVSNSLCKCLDRDKNNAVDATEVTQFQNCVTGAEVPWIPDLTPDCVTD